MRTNTLENYYKGCGNKLSQAPFVEVAEKCGEYFDGSLYLCKNCQAKIQAHKQRAKDELEFLRNNLNDKTILFSKMPERIKQIEEELKQEQENERHI